MFFFARNCFHLTHLGKLRRVTFWLGRKSPKTHQREIPLESPGFNCFFQFRPKSALGLVGRIGWLGTSLDSVYSAGSLRSFLQGLRSGCSGLRPAAVGRGAPQVGPKWGERRTPQQRQRKRESLFLLVWQIPFGPVWEATPPLLGKRGRFHKEGEGPSFGDSFPDFSSLRNRAQRSVPTRLASLRLRYRRRTDLRFYPCGWRLLI